MKNNSEFSTLALVRAAVFAALTFVATFAVKIQTPTFGYIHMGDCFVLLSGLILGGTSGALAAGIGSALSDLLAGYVIWVPGTFIIKFFVALAAWHTFHSLSRVFISGEVSTAPHLKHEKKFPAGLLIISGLAGELIMIAGYFFYNIIIISLTAGELSAAALAAAITESAAEIPFNILQGGAGILLSILLYPLVRRGADTPESRI